MPRKDFDTLELRLAGAIDIGRKTAVPDLTGDIHAVFQGWRIDDVTAIALFPSLQLASKLIQVGLPYISNFLPSKHKTFWYKEDGTRIAPQVIPIDLNQSPEDLREADDDLRKLGEELEWRLNRTIYRRQKLYGVTRLVDPGDEPWADVEPDEIRAWDRQAKALGKQCRPLVIGIMEEYVKAIQDSDPESEEHLRATFMLAITLTHELGHAVFLQDFTTKDVIGDPFVDDDCEAEIGFAFISRIFSGFHPQFAETTPDGLPAFKQTIYWEPRYGLKMRSRPLYKTFYSIPITYIEKVLSQRFWDDIGPPGRPGFSEKARRELLPDTEERIGRVATGAVPNWTYEHLMDRPEWKSNYFFRMPGYQKHNPIPKNALSQKEIDLERDLSRNTEEYRSIQKLNKDERRQRYYWANNYYRPDEAVDDLVFEEDPAQDPTRPEGRTRFLNIDDGILARDLYPPSENDATPLTRIEVRYLAGEAKLRRLSLGKPITIVENCLTLTDEELVDETLEKRSPEALIEKNRLEWHNQCIEWKLSSFANFSDLESWQKGNPDLRIDDDMGVAQRLYNYAIHELLDKFGNIEFNRSVTVSNASKIELKIASLESVPDWSDEDLRLFCEKQGLNSNRNRRGLILQAQKCKKADIKESTMRTAAVPDARWDSYIGSGPANKFQERKAKNPRHWGDIELLEFCRSRGLPSWGTRKALTKRVQICQREESPEESRLPFVWRDQTSRLDGQDFELYVFKAILGQSSVIALKSEIFVAGNFEAEAVFTLFFHPNESDILTDTEPLSSYNQKDWTKVRLKVSEKWRFGPGMPDEKSAIDLTGPGKPIIKFKYPPRNQNSKTQEPASPRSSSLEHENPTIADLFEQIANRGKILNGIIERKSRLGSALPQKQSSGLGSLEILEDYEDILETVKKEFGTSISAAKQTAVPPYFRPHQAPTGYSHMADIYNRIESNDEY